MTRTNGDIASLGYFAGLAENLFFPNTTATEIPFPTNLFPSYSLVGTIVGDGTKLGDQPSVFFGWVLKEAGTNIIYTVIRGTIRAVEWIQDATFNMVSSPTGHGRVEDGFNYVYQSLKVNGQSLVDFVSSQNAPSYGVIGHSLGSAVATYFAVDLAAKVNPKLVELFALASPMTGDQTYVNYAASLANLSRYVVNNYTDLVPKLPPSDAGYVALPDIEIVNPAELATLNPPRYMPNDPLANHMVENYVGMLDITVFDNLRLGAALNPEIISTTKPSTSLLTTVVSSVTNALNSLFSWL